MGETQRRQSVAAARVVVRLLVVALLAVPLLVGSRQVPVASAAAPSFAFNWTGTPPAAQQWVPAAMNDWDLLEINQDPMDQIKGGTFPAAHGAGCTAPPDTHSVTNLVDSVYICNNHMMTANNESDTFFTPNQLVDFSHGTATVSFQVSTSRFSQRDWWEMWLMPYGENFTTPTDNAPTFNGNPDDSLHILMNQRNGCTLGQPTWPVDANTGSHEGTLFEYVLYRGGNAVQKGGGDGGCMEDVAGGASPKTRSTFTLAISQGHIRFSMAGPGGEALWINDNASLAFNQAVVMWAHRSYNPSKACGFDGTCGPNTFHWSNISISPSVPFTMLRPAGVSTIHDGAATRVTLPQAAPANSFLRFAAFGNVRVSYDGGAFASPHRQDTAFRPESASSYFAPIPAGTRTVSFEGSSRVASQPWWVMDVAVWSGVIPTTIPGQPGRPPAAQPAPAAAQPAAGAAVGGMLLTEWDALRGQGVAPAIAKPAAAAASGPLAALARVPPFVSGFAAALLLVALAGVGYATWHRRRRRSLPPPGK